MFSSALQLVGTALSFVFGVFTQLLTQTGLLGPFLGVFAAFLAVRFLIVPLTGGGKKGGDGGE